MKQNCVFFMWLFCVLNLCLSAQVCSGELSSVKLISSEVTISQTQFTVLGPPEVEANQEFDFTIYIQNPPHKDVSQLLVYFYPPKCFEFVSADSSDPELLLVSYDDDLNRVYGECHTVKDTSNISILVKLKALPEGVHYKERDTASYFSFFVCPHNGEVKEYYRRQGIRIVDKLEN